MVSAVLDSGSERVHTIDLNPIDNIAGDAVEKMANAFGDKVIDLLEATSSFWVKVPAPSVGELSPDETSAHPTGAVAWIWEQTHWYAIAFAILGLIAGGCRLMITQRGQDLQQLLHDFLRFVLTVTIGLPAIIVLTAWSDELAEGIIESAMGVDPDEGMSAMLGAQLLTQQGAAMIFVLGTVALLVSLFQIAVLIIRGGMLVLVVGFLPLAAAGIGTQTGRQMSPKLIGWILAFILYKPVAALIYGAGMVLVKTPSFGSNEDSSMLTVATGLAIMAMSVLALPALMKLCVPLVAAAAGGQGAGMFLAAGAGTAVATGAMLAGGGAGVTAGSAAASHGSGQLGRSGGGGSDSAPSGGNPNSGGPSPGHGGGGGSPSEGAATSSGSTSSSGNGSTSPSTDTGTGTGDQQGQSGRSSSGPPGSPTSPTGSGQSSTPAPGTSGDAGGSSTSAGSGSAGPHGADTRQSARPGSTAQSAAKGVTSATDAASDEIEGGANPDGSK